MASWKKLFLEQTVAQWFFQLRLLVLFLFVEVKRDLGNKNYHMIQVNQTTSPTLSDRITSLRGDHTVKSVVFEVLHVFFYCIQISNLKDDLAKSCGLKKFNVSHSGQFRSPQHIPQVPALERSSVAAMVPGIWGLAIWGQRIDLAVHIQWQLVEHELFWSNETSFSTNMLQLFFLSCPISVFQSIDDNRESLRQELNILKRMFTLNPTKTSKKCSDCVSVTGMRPQDSGKLTSLLQMMV